MDCGIFQNSSLNIINYYYYHCGPSPGVIYFHYTTTLDESALKKKLNSNFSTWFVI